MRVPRKPEIISGPWRTDRLTNAGGIPQPRRMSPPANAARRDSIPINISGRCKRSLSAISLNLQILSQCDSIVMPDILSAKQECHMTPNSRIQKRPQGIRLSVQLCKVAAPELFPPLRIMPEPFPEGITRCRFFQPISQMKGVPFYPPRPEAVHQKSGAVTGLRLIINPLHPDHADTHPCSLNFLFNLFPIRYQSRLFQFAFVLRLSLLLHQQ